MENLDESDNGTNESIRFSTIAEAISVVKETKNFGFVMETSYADFVTAENCQLTSVGRFGERQYAVAFPKNSLYKDQGRLIL